jgi:hypothetical protein
VGAASTTPGRVGTARRLGFGKRDGEVYVCRNQWWNPLKKSDRLEPGGCGPGWQFAACLYNRGGWLQAGGVVGLGVAMKDCGVVATWAAGEKLGTDPVNRFAVNVGTVFGSPSCRPAWPMAARHVVC